MPPSFDHDASVAGVRRYFDVFAEQEWDRLGSDLVGQVSFEVHRRFLARFVEPGMRVLEVGAGPGRFTVPLVELGARVVVTDVSEVQLALNRSRTEGLPGVEGWALADVCDLAAYETGSFDAVVAYGGPVSYAFDRAGTAISELLRVTRYGGPALASVMSTPGAYRHLLPGVVSVIEAFGDEANQRILETGDLREIQPPDAGHSCRMFRWRELADLITASGGTVLAASASNWASLGDPAAVARLAEDPARWARFVDAEVDLCAEPGVWDGSTHVMFAATHGTPAP